MASDRAAEYRRLAQECVNLARTVSTGESRDQFMLMAQVWSRLAEEQDPHPVDAEEQDPYPVDGPGGEPPRAVQQQQQQPQPDDDADGS